MHCFDFLDKPIAFHRSFSEVSGSVCAGIFLSQCVYWSKRTNDPDGWFYKSQSEWTEETTLSRREQESSRKRLKELGIIEEKKEGLPCRIYFRVNVAQLEAIFTEHFRQKQLGKLDCTKPPTKHAQSDRDSLADLDSTDSADPPDILYTEITSLDYLHKLLAKTIEPPLPPTDAGGTNREPKAVAVVCEIMQPELQPPKQPELAKTPKVRKSIKAGSGGDPFWSEVIKTYNENKSDLWAAVTSFGPKRQKAFQLYRDELGDQESLTALARACQYAAKDKWWGPKEMTIDNLMASNRVISFSEKWQVTAELGGIHAVLNDPTSLQALERQQRSARRLANLQAKFGIPN
ncbi:MAG: hypothetical protein DDT26_01511 [Dehalococcoidia bacterium]|nr:hypothetical protein [Chloroflexota bacterium]